MVTADEVPAEYFKNAKPILQFNRYKFEQQGMGIGLAIAELIVKKMGGAIEFSDNSPCGILVTIRIPFQHKHGAMEKQFDHVLMNN